MHRTGCLTTCVLNDVVDSYTSFLLFVVAVKKIDFVCTVVMLECTEEYL